jgi:hypothetical protein
LTLISAALNLAACFHMADPRVLLAGYAIAAAVPPAQHRMSFDDCAGVMIHQETNVCCKCCCCKPNVNYRMLGWQQGEYTADGRTDIPATWFIAESAGFCPKHCFFTSARATTWSVHEGDDATGRVIMTHSKGATCAVFASDCEILRILCCCCLPYLETKDEHGNKLGTTKYVCDQWLCVPKFDVFDANDQRMFRIRSETCCFGCCPACRSGGHGRFRVPQQVRHPEPPFDTIPEADITDLWEGGRRRCTKQELLGVRFPHSNQHGQDVRAAKATLVGTALLVKTLLYDHDEA